MGDLESLIRKHACWNMASNIDTLCKSLLSELGINYFDYTRFYKDGTFSPVFSDKDYIVTILETGKAKQHQTYKPPTKFLPPGTYLWQSYIDENFLEEADKKFAHFYGVTIIRHGKLFDELINFSAPKSNSNVLDTYQNYPLVLDIFCGNFLTEYSSFFQKAHNRCKLPEQYEFEKIEDSTIEKSIKFLSNIYAKRKLKKNQILLPLGQTLVTFTKTEFRCLRLVVDGCSSKEIARILNISPRTVEIHLSTILKKTQKNNRYALMAAFSKSLLVELERLLT